MPHLKNHLVYVPKLGHSSRSHLIRGKGAGKLLLDGGRGKGHSYESVSEFKKITNPPMGGSGLKKSITDKLEKLEIKEFPKSRKPKNISFSV